MTKLKQFKCLTDLEKMLAGVDEYRARPVIRGKHATLYDERANGNYRTVMGIRICDYKFCTDERWILPHPQKGLSFSASWDNLKFVYGMFKKRAKKKPVDIHWIISETDIPPGLKFVPDESNADHYFLTVTERMLVEKLVSKLKAISHRMSIIQNGGAVL
ncbi:MAG: hypothetical protein ACI93R_003133 [Flavobacteriales bacterium]